MKAEKVFSGYRKHFFLPPFMPLSAILGYPTWSNADRRVLVPSTLHYLSVYKGSLPPLNCWFKVLFSLLSERHLLYYFITLLSAARAIPRFCDEQEKEIRTHKLWWGQSLPLGGIPSLDIVLTQLGNFKTPRVWFIILLVWSRRIPRSCINRNTET